MKNLNFSDFICGTLFLGVLICITGISAIFRNLSLLECHVIYIYIQGSWSPLKFDYILYYHFLRTVSWFLNEIEIAKSQVLFLYPITSNGFQTTTWEHLVP
jgi:hypothetical protein